MHQPSASDSKSARDVPTPALIFAAYRRTLVTLPDGKVGELVHVSPESRKAKVKVGGHHVRLTADELIINPS